MIKQLNCNIKYQIMLEQKNINVEDNSEKEYLNIENIHINDENIHINDGNNKSLRKVLSLKLRIVFLIIIVMVYLVLPPIQIWNALSFKQNNLCEYQMSLWLMVNGSANLSYIMLIFFAMLIDTCEIFHINCMSCYNFMIIICAILKYSYIIIWSVTGIVLICHYYNEYHNNFYILLVITTIMQLFFIFAVLYIIIKYVERKY